jgi:hypothetical protein
MLKESGLSNNEQELAEPVIACNLKAIDAAELDAHFALAQAVFSPSTVLEIKEVAHGYAFRMPLETAMLHKAIDFVANERLCCPFFTKLETRMPPWFPQRGHGNRGMKGLPGQSCIDGHAVLYS